jgi:hypothetical protein
MHFSSYRKAGILLVLAIVIASIVPTTGIFAVSLAHASPQKALACRCLPDEKVRRAI